MERNRLQRNAGAHRERRDVLVGQARATQVGIYAESDTSIQRVTQAGIYAETGTPVHYVTQVGIYAELTSWLEPVVYRVEIDWNRDGTYTDETAYVVAARGTHRLVSPEQSISGGGAGIVDQCTVTLNNSTKRFSSRNAAGALYATIADGGAYQAPMIVQVKIEGVTTKLFTGYVRGISEQARTAMLPASVTLDCRSREDLLLQMHASTATADYLAAVGAAEDTHLIQRLEEAGFVDGTDFVSEAYALANTVAPTIDYGMFPLRYTWTDDEPPLQDAWSIAGAAMGWFYCDPDGIFRYRNMAGLLGDLAERQFGTDDLIVLNESNTAALTLQYEDAELYNRIEVEVSPRALGIYGVAWEAETTPRVEAGGSLTLWAKYRHPLALDDASVSFTARYASGATIASGISTAVTSYAQRARIVIGNATAADAYLVDFAVYATPLEAGDPFTIEAVSADAFWTTRAGRVRTVRGSEYIQAKAHADTIANYLLTRQQTPRLFARVAGIHDPAVRVGKRVQIGYPFDVTTSAIVAVVVNTDWTLSAAGFNLNARAMDMDGLFPCEPYFVLGTNTLGTGLGVDDAKLFW